MMQPMLVAAPMEARRATPQLAANLQSRFAGRLKKGEPLARYTSARIGGRAEYFLAVETGLELAEAARWAYRVAEIPFRVLGGGSNVLVADAGVRGLVILNRAKEIAFREAGGEGIARAESGAALGVLARQAVQAGYSGLEWAATVPGTVGGAVVGNAGAHGGDTAGGLRVAEILQQDGMVRLYSAADLKFAYRTSTLKSRAQGQAQPRAVVISAEFRLKRDDPARILRRVEAHVAQRKRTQPPGASIGSMFKNPPEEYAGRLIEAAGLKGKRIGAAEISTLHANFFVNLGGATAADVRALIELARETVHEKFGFDMEPEIELVGEWGE
jgi:UDP-N-acetylmuramate dehydrogenase